MPVWTQPPCLRACPGIEKSLVEMGQIPHKRVVLSSQISEFPEQMAETICLTLSSMQAVKVIWVYLFPVYEPRTSSTLENVLVNVSPAGDLAPQQGGTGLETLGGFHISRFALVDLNI